MMKDNTAVEDFARDLITERFGSMPSAVLTELVKTACDGIMKLVRIEIVSAVPAEAASRFDAWLDDPNATQEGFDTIMREAGVDTTKVARKAMIEYKEEFLRSPAV